MQGLISIDPDGEITLRPGAHYDQMETNYVLYFVLRETAKVMSTLTTVTYQVGTDGTIGSKESSWLAGAKPVFDEVRSLLKQLDEWAADQFGEICESLEQSHRSAAVFS